MRAWTALIPFAVLVLFPGCQRLPGDEGDPPPSTDPTDDGPGGTLLPPSNNDDDNADETGDSMNACDPTSQVGCTTDEKCTAILSGGEVIYACVADSGTLNPSAPCTASHEDGIDGCAAGTVCLEDEGGNGICSLLCETNGDCEQADCLRARESDIPYCAADCSPFGSFCPAPTQCRRNGNRFSCSFIGLADVGGDGSPCAISQDGGCAPGLVCVPGALVPNCGSDNCCVGLCDVGDSDPCASPSTCNAILTGAAPGFEDIGACFVPA